VRKILYSPGYGAGWTTWAYTSNREVLKFMLEYPPFVQGLEGEQAFEKGARTYKMLILGEDNTVHLAPEGYAETEFKDEYQRQHPKEQYTSVQRYPACLPLDHFIEEYTEKFPDEDLPYFGGLADLKVYEVPDGARVRVKEYDGSETVEVEGEFEGWM